jgi:hypothetical protein
VNAELPTSNPEPRTDAAFAEAREVQWVWKSPAMEAMAVAVCRLAVERAGQEFSANDLTLAEHGGQGIAGSIFRTLADNEVIAPVGTFDAAKQFQPKYVTNAGGNPVRVWRLVSYARALRLIEVHGGRAGAELKQAEFAVS